MASEFSTFFATAEPRLRRALVATYGFERGREAAAEALAWAWAHWDEVQAMTSPIPYLYRVGQSRTRAPKRRKLFDTAHTAEVRVEPGLVPALARLSERQRLGLPRIW